MVTSAAGGSSAKTQWPSSSHQSDFAAMADAYAEAVSSLGEQAEQSDFAATADAYAKAVSSLREQAETMTASLIKNGSSLASNSNGLLYLQG